MNPENPQHPPPPDADGPWRQGTRDRWFYGYLTAALVAFFVLVLPFAGALLFAATTVAVTWPWYRRMLALCRGRRGLAAVLTELLVILVVLGPLVLLGGWFVQQAVVVAQRAGSFLAEGGLEAALGQALDLELPGRDVWGPWILGPGSDPVGSLMKQLGASVLALGQMIGTAAPNILGSVASTVLDAGVFLFAVATLYAQGPNVARAAMVLSPMDDAYDRRLFAVFQEFSYNLVVGALGTAAVQGVVAGIGYAIAGVDNLVLVAILTAVLSFVPVVGTAIVWVPVAIVVGVNEGVGWGVFVAVWSLVLTGSVDNVVRPLLMRGSSDIHPLIIFLAVLGGLAWMGVPGVLVGPVVAAVFLALFTIYRTDFLGLPATGTQPPAA